MNHSPFFLSSFFQEPGFYPPVPLPALFPSDTSCAWSEIFLFFFRACEQAPPPPPPPPGFPSRTWIRRSFPFFFFLFVAGGAISVDVAESLFGGTVLRSPLFCRVPSLLSLDISIFLSSRTELTSALWPVLRAGDAGSMGSFLSQGACFFLGEDASLKS